jgi:ABC-type transport system involved in cytochrome c biogenesis permease component
MVHRELRVSARNKATHRWRILFAWGAVAIGGGLGLLSMSSGGIGAAQLGLWIFEALKWIAFVFACAAGTFLTADCLSEEKREGTLGLLFLTDLRGHDVVLGKLLATSLRTFYSLLAIFPVMALSFVLGGVAADDFRHSLLAVCNTLFFSLALGMAVSVISRDPHKAMTGAVAAMIAFMLLTPELDWLLLGRNANAPLIRLLSPAFAFTHTSSYHAADFWRSLLLVHLAGWCFLALASWLAPKTWREKEARPGPGTRWQFALFSSAGARSRSRIFLDKNPICWIISRDRWASNLARLALLLVVGVFALSLSSLSQSPGPATTAPIRSLTTNGTTITVVNLNSPSTFSMSWGGRIAANSLYQIASGCASVLSLALEFWLAAHVCRFYVEGKRNGFLELMLVTPIRPADILHGHWLALRRLFLAPIAAQLLLTLSCGAIGLWATRLTAFGVVPAGRATVGALPPKRALEMAQFLALGLGTISWCLGLFTIVWFAIWMGLASNKINLAMLKTFCYAKILPWFGMSFAWGFLLFAMARIFHSDFFWFPVMSQLIFIGVNLALISLARRQAREAFSKWSNAAAA